MIRVISGSLGLPDFTPMPSVNLLGFTCCVGWRAVTLPIILPGRYFFWKLQSACCHLHIRDLHYQHTLLRLLSSTTIAWKLSLFSLLPNDACEKLPRWKFNYVDYILMLILFPFCCKLKWPEVWCNKIHANNGRKDCIYKMQFCSFLCKFQRKNLRTR